MCLSLCHVHVSVCPQRQIQLCGLQPHNPLAMKEVQFLATLCFQINTDPCLADFFLTERAVAGRARGVSVRATQPGAVPGRAGETSEGSGGRSGEPSGAGDGSQQSSVVYLVTEALQRLANHNDSLVSIKAYECLLSCVSLQHHAVARAMAGSNLPILLASKLQYHFQLIPPSCPHSAIMGCNVGWG